MRRLFAAARRCQPCVVLIEDVDVLGAVRAADGSGSAGVERRALSQMLNEMDGIEDSSGVVVLGTTNRQLDSLDPAMLRPGRLEMHLHVGLPSREDRAAIVGGFAEAMATGLEAAKVAEALVDRTEGMSVAELLGIFQHAALEVGPGAIDIAELERAAADAASRAAERV